MLKKLTKILDTLGYLNYKIVFLIDLLVLVLATFISCILTSTLVKPQLSSTQIFFILVYSVLISGILLAVSRIHRTIIRYSFLKDAWTFLVISIVKTAVMALVIRFSFDPQLTHSQFICCYVFDMAFSFTFLIIIRITMMRAYDIIMGQRNSKRMNAIIYGIDNDSFSLMTKMDHKSDYRICGFYVYGNKYKRYNISGNKIFYFNDEADFMNITQRYNISAVIFPNKDKAIEEKNRLINYCLDHDVKVLITPQADEIKNTNLEKLNKIVREVKIEDLLMRDEIQIEMNSIKNHFRGKTVLITGAAGSIGSELCNQLAIIGIGKMILLDIAETPVHNIRLKLSAHYPDLDFVAIVGDVRMKRSVERTISTYRPDIIFHAAAYKHVPLMEESPCEAILTNAHGTKQVADMAVKYGVEKMILVSTDKAVNPTNVMGASKRLAEIYVQSLGLAIEAGKREGRTKFITTRFGNVLGSQGSVIPMFRSQIAAGGPVTVTHPEITRFFMTIPEACKLMVQSATIGHNNEIVVFDMGQSVRIVDLAFRMIQLAGFVPGKDIEIVYTGLRPGEKLYEEVLGANENTIPTPHKKIRIAKVRKYSYDDVVLEIRDVIKSAFAGDEWATVEMMKEMIPEYHSENSIFEKLDQKFGKVSNG